MDSQLCYCPHPHRFFLTPSLFLAEIENPHQDHQDFDPTDDPTEPTFPTVPTIIQPPLPQVSNCKDELWAILKEVGATNLKLQFFLETNSLSTTFIVF